jgi:hypothetical protein
VQQGFWETGVKSRSSPCGVRTWRIIGFLRAIGFGGWRRGWKSVQKQGVMVWGYRVLLKKVIREYKSNKGLSCCFYWVKRVRLLVYWFFGVDGKKIFFIFCQKTNKPINQ